MNNLIVQGIGMIGLISIVIAFQSNKRHMILSFLLVGHCAFITHFFLLGAWTGVALNAVAIFRTTVFNLKEKHKWAQKNYWEWIMIILFLIFGLSAWEGLRTLLPTSAMILGTLALWSTKTNHIRILMIATKPLWFTYNLLSNSIPGMITEVFVFFSILVSIIKYDIHPKQKHFS